MDPSSADEKGVVAKPVSFPNGALKKHNHCPPLSRDQQLVGLYRECLKNHAASLGSHALDGCGEFMPSPSSDPAVPASLTCAACGCHRNFHRRLRFRQPDDDSDEDEEVVEEGGEHHQFRRRRRRSSSSPPPPPPPPPPYYSSAPHMLLALSAGLGPTHPGSSLARPISPSAPERPQASPATAVPRKRFRTKFTAEQKERMHELSERLGWRMQRRDEGMVEAACREIGVPRAVFKVWMHNNKHTAYGGGSLSRRGPLGAANNGGDESNGMGDATGGGEDGSTAAERKEVGYGSYTSP